MAVACDSRLLRCCVSVNGCMCYAVRHILRIRPAYALHSAYKRNLDVSGV